MHIFCFCQVMIFWCSSSHYYFSLAAIVGVIAWMGYTMATAVSLEGTEEKNRQ